MNNDQSRNRIAIAILAICSITFLGGCSFADATTLEAFVTGMFRSAASALLL
ncbi:MAG: hypothetical protein GXP29_14010 [Planctomycetes bacterium]|nr:hypothetical protein [Planctomycetota bacterium]